MKRLIEKYSGRFIREDGTLKYCMIFEIPFAEIPDDLDFAEYKVDIVNVLWDANNDPSGPDGITCRLKVTEFDDRRNAIWITVPKWIQDALYQSNQQGIERAKSILAKMLYENDLVKRNMRIPYDNHVGG